MNKEMKKLVKHINKMTKLKRKDFGSMKDLIKLKRKYDTYKKHQLEEV